MVSVSGLPDVSTEPTDAEVAQYARETQASESEVRRKKPLARSYWAFPIEVEGRRWGVVVVDSRSPEAIGKRALPEYQGLVMMISRLLERRAS